MQILKELSSRLVRRARDAVTTVSSMMGGGMQRVGWCMSIVPALRRQWQIDPSEFQSSLVYILSSKSSRSTLRNPEKSCLRVGVGMRGTINVRKAHVTDYTDLSGLTSLPSVTGLLADVFTCQCGSQM